MVTIHQSANNTIIDEGPRTQSEFAVTSSVESDKNSQRSLNNLRLRRRYQSQNQLREAQWPSAADHSQWVPGSVPKLIFTSV